MNDLQLNTSRKTKYNPRHPMPKRYIQGYMMQQNKEDNTVFRTADNVIYQQNQKDKALHIVSRPDKDELRKKRKESTILTVEEAVKRLTPLINDLVRLQEGSTEQRRQSILALMETEMMECFKRDHSCLLAFKRRYRKVSQLVNQLKTERPDLLVPEFIPVKI